MAAVIQTTDVVHKFRIPMQEKFGIKMPVGATILHVAPQAGEPCLWARVNPNAEDELREFVLAGTGHQIPRAYMTDSEYVATWQVGAYVWHLFEVIDHDKDQS